MPTVASNRLPVVLSRTDDGSLISEPASGGLVTALEPVLRERGGSWVGWPGVPQEECEDLGDSLEGSGFELRPIPIDEDELALHYHGFCNSVLWPLLHGMPRRCERRAGDWETYMEINARFAEELVRTGDSAVWVHDYQLMMVGSEMRRRGSEQRLGFFLHVPFPEPGILFRSGRAIELLSSLAHYDVVGFQTTIDLRNFVDALSLLYPRAKVEEGPSAVVFQIGGRRVLASVYPIGIAASEFEAHASRPQVEQRAAELRAELACDNLIVGVDRLDYSKGLLERIDGFQRFLEEHPERRDDTVYMQLVVPSRLQVPAYQDLLRQLEARVGEFYSHLGTFDRMPLRYVFDSVERAELLALYRAGDIGLVTPIRDGMNLVAKEYCASQVDDSGALILTDTAGAARQLAPGALIIEPGNPDEIATAIDDALRMDDDQRRERMRSLRAEIRESCVERWAESFLIDLEHSRAQPSGTVVAARATAVFHRDRHFGTRRRLVAGASTPTPAAPAVPTAFGSSSRRCASPWDPSH